MSDKIISLHIPADDRNAITAAAAFFNTLANAEPPVGEKPLGHNREGFAEMEARFNAAAHNTPEPKPETTESEPVNLAQERQTKLEPDATQTAPQASTTTEPQAAPDEYPIDNNGVKLSKDGVPWDDRICSSNRKCYKSGADAGRWMKRKGVDKEEYERVTAELKAAMSNGGQPVEQPQPEQQFDAGSAFTQQQQKTAPAFNNAAEFFSYVSSAGYSDAAMAAVCQSRGWGSLSMAAAVAGTNPNVFAEIVAELDQLKGQGV